MSFSSRETASRIVARWISTGDFPDRLLENVRDDRAFLKEVVFGVVRHRRSLEFILSELALRPPAAPIRACALVGLYQLLHMDRTEPFAAVHETVEAAKRVAGSRAAGFVNAMLRRAQREADRLRDALSRQPAAVRFSHPDVLWDRWVRARGEADTMRLAEWNNQRAETWIRRRPGASFEKSPRGAAVESLEGYAEGDFVVQDPATLLSVELLDPRPGERVLDACAAPGGKTIAVADRMAGRGSLVALDLHEDRLAVLRENLARAQCGWVEVRRADATKPSDLGPFDRVLLDAPCSNTGVIRRRPDARWRFSEERLAKLLDVQSRLLDGASALVKPGGRIVYSTCSLEPDENEQQVETWLNRHTDFVLLEQRTSFPPDSGMDGAFAAALQRA